MIDTTNLKVYRKREKFGDRENEWREEHLVRVTESDQKITKHFVITISRREWDDERRELSKTPTLSQLRRSETQQKFLCIGGQFNRQRRALTEDEQRDYEPYNRAAFGRSGKDRPHKVIQVYKFLLED